MWEKREMWECGIVGLYKGSHRFLWDLDHFDFVGLGWVFKVCYNFGLFSRKL